MSQVDRKWDGIPHTEQKRLPPPENIPKAFGPRRSSPKPETAVYRLGHFFWGSFFSKMFSPHVGVPVSSWCIYGACEFVIKRLKALILKDKDAHYYYIVSQATKEQISPEFSSPENIANWLLYRGLMEGWVKLNSITWRGEVRYRLDKKDSF